MAKEIVRCPSCGARNRVPSSGRGHPRCGTCHVDLPWIVAAGDATFADAVDTRTLVLVDLWAAWCGPCRAIAPVLEQLAVRHAGRLKVVKVDVDKAPAVSRRFDVRSIPMLVLLRDGVVLETLIGAQPARVVRFDG
jgi:thioredoxin 2